MLKPSERLNAALNEQIGHEMLASMQYLAIGNFFKAETLPELAAFFYRQADEERTHAIKFIDFLLDVEGEVEIPAIPAPKGRFASAEEAISLALAGEQKVTGQIYDLVDLAREDRNHGAQRFLDWFVTEQQEEEATMNALLAVVRRAREQNLLHVEDYLARQGAALAGGQEG